MSEIKYVGPSLWPYHPLGGFKVRLEHSEIEKIAEASAPVATISALIPSGGPIVAATISLLMWVIKHVDKKYGNRGVVIVSWGIKQVRGPHEWAGDD